MTDLSSVTLFCLDCVDVQRAIRVLEHCQKLCQFGAVRFLTSLPTDYPHDTIRPINSLNDYSAFMVKCAYQHVDTSHMLVVQHDGWILNPDAWKPQWLQYDYIGPLFLQETVINEQTVGSGGFSLRSKALMEFVSKSLPDWDGQNSYNHRDGRNFWAHEDGVISKDLRESAKRNGLVYAPISEAAQFAYGGNAHQYCPHPFGFHGFYAIDRLRGGIGDGYSPHVTP